MLDFCTLHLYYLDILIMVGCGNFPFMGDITHSWMLTPLQQTVTASRRRVSPCLQIPGVTELAARHVIDGCAHRCVDPAIGGVGTTVKKALSSVQRC